MRIEQQFDVDCAIERVYSEINNIGEIGQCVAGVRDVQAISEDESMWVVEVRAGFITRKFKIRGVITERRPPDGLSFAGYTQDIEVSGDVRLSPLDGNRTRCFAAVEFEVSGPMAPLIELMAKGPQQRMISETIANLRARLEAAGGGPVSAPPLAPVAKPGVWGRAVEWLRALLGGGKAVPTQPPAASAMAPAMAVPARSRNAERPLSTAVPKVAAPRAPADGRSADARYSHVLSPIKVGPVEIANRFYMPPHGVPLITGGPANTSVPSERFAQYYGERARGGTGLLIHSISLPPNSRNLACAAHPDSVPAFARVAEVVHESGAKIFAQLHYAMLTGSKWGSLTPDIPILGPSSIQQFQNFGTVREMGRDEISCLVAAFGKSARHLRQAGYDGIEVHCSHGVLIEQFLSPFWNKRTDEYGGSLENRMRLLVEALEAVRREGGDQMAYGIRLNCDEMLAGGMDQSDAREVLGILIERGLIDFCDLDVAVEPQQAPLMTAPPYIAPLHITSFIDSVREAARSIKVIGVLGRVTNLDQADRAIALGTVDMVGSARGLIAEPELVKNAREGREDRNRTCLACNWCIAAMMEGGTFGCLVNPATGREYQWGLQVPRGTMRKERVVVVGGGPAGLESARVAAQSGHSVLLLEKRDVLGGQLNLWGQLPEHAAYLQTPLWYAERLEELGVEVRTGIEATAQMIVDEKPDTVIIASGSSYEPSGETSVATSPMPGAGQSFVYAPEDILERGLRPGGRVVVLDEEGISTGPGIADILAEAGAEVIVVTRQFHLGPHLLYNMHLPFILPRLDALGVEVRTRTHIKEIGERSVVVFDILTNDESVIEDVDSVVLAGMRKPVGRLAGELEGRVPALLVVGDALAPRGLAEATYEGHRFARGIGSNKAPRTMAEAIFPAWLKD